MKSDEEELMPRLLPVEEFDVEDFDPTLLGCQPAPEGFSSSLKWQQLQVANFSDVRQIVNKHREHWKLQSLDNNVVMPNPEDEEGWLKFCLGEKVYFDMMLSQDENENPGIDYVKVKTIQCCLKLNVFSVCLRAKNSQVNLH
ncbi:GEMI2 protein, partial [Polyodon spathula]|nr:GEMI2 protein [Polyodon spathula]